MMAHMDNPDYDFMIHKNLYHCKIKGSVMISLIENN